MFGIATASFFSISQTCWLTAASGSRKEVVAKPVIAVGIFALNFAAK